MWRFESVHGFASVGNLYQKMHFAGSNLSTDRKTAPRTSLRCKNASTKFRKPSETKKAPWRTKVREKSLEISRFLVFSCLHLNQTRIMAGIAGLEPAKCKSQSLVPYRLGYIPICLCLDILSHIKSIVNIKIPPKRDFCLYITFCAHSAFQARRNRFCQAL